MRTFIVPLIALIAAACGAPHTETPPAPAQGAAAAASLQVHDAWAAPTPGGVEVSSGYLTIVNGANADDRLTGASSPRAARIEVHEMTMDGAVMRMRAIEGGLVVPSHAAVSLSPGGMHLMFYGVSQPFTEGDSIPLTLTFEHAGDVAVTLPVRREGPHAH